jgi:hypothetical protein
MVWGVQKRRTFWISSIGRERNIVYANQKKLTSRYTSAIDPAVQYLSIPNGDVGWRILYLQKAVAPDR